MSSSGTLLLRLGLNRTSVGLKLRFWAFIWFLGLCLNRTSVGLKRKVDEERLQRWRAPQSNQRGIETGTYLKLLPPRPGPQSNQRGIETQILNTQ